MIRGLTVLQVAYPFAPVGPGSVGGAEQILSGLDRALYARGHRSLVVACEGSHVKGELFESPLPRSRFDAASCEATRAMVRTLVERVLASHQVDVLHVHGVDFDRTLPRTRVPALITLHLPFEFYAEGALHALPGHAYAHCVSGAQERRAPPGLRLLSAISNGVSLADFAPREEKGEYALVACRICPEKGVHLALDAARKAGLPMLVAGEVFPYPEHQRYFREQIAPRLDDARRFLGPVPLPHKAELLARARCLVVPSLVEETSSLVSMEALASGTPVVAFRRGALEELIDHGRTGLLVTDPDEHGAAMRDARDLDGGFCRHVAEARCSDTVMHERYFAVYEELARQDGPLRVSSSPHSGGVAPAKHPRSLQARAHLSLEVVSSLERLSELERPWIALWDGCPGATLFQRPEWLLAYSRILLRGALSVLAVWQGSELVGLVPWFIWRDGSARVLSLLGAGVSDYQDALIRPSVSERIAREISSHLRTDASDWDRCKWSELVAGSVLRELAVPDTRTTSEPQELCLSLELEGGMDSLLGRAGSHVRRNVRQASRTLEDSKTLHWESVCPDTFDEFFSALERLHGARRNQLGDEGALEKPEVRAFHRAAGRALLDSSMLFVCGYRAENALVAALYGFRDRGVVRSYLCGFDPTFSRRSLGTLLIARSIERAISEGATHFDFMRGDEVYKRHWGAREHMRLETRTIENAGEVSSLARLSQVPGTST